MIALINFSNEEHNISIDWKDMGFKESDSAVVRDLWSHEDIGNFTQKFESKKIPVHGNIILKVTLIEKNEILN